jgi:hypothetical protein
VEGSRSNFQKWKVSKRKKKKKKKGKKGEREGEGEDKKKLPSDEWRVRSTRKGTTCRIHMWLVEGVGDDGGSRWRERE